MNTNKNNYLLLIHGLASSELMFYYPTNNALGKLLEKDFKVLLARLRHGRGNKYFPSWNFEDYLFIDIPKIWKESITISQSYPIVVGYSLGGMLALIAQALKIINAPKIVAIASPFLFPFVPFYPNALSITQNFLSYFNLKQMPVRLLGKLVVWYFSKLKPSIVKIKYLSFLKQVNKVSLNIPINLLIQVCFWLKLGYICNFSQNSNYYQMLKNIHSPVLLIGGSKDTIAPPNILLKTYKLIACNNPKNDIFIIDNADHVSLTFGTNAINVYKIIYNWVLNK